MPDAPALSPTAVLRTWWPLAASWLLMGAEIPLIAAVVSRLTGAEVHLAAFGGVVFPLALVIEAPVIMMLAASTALCTDRDSFDRLKRFMTRLAVALTAIHALIVFTPLFEWIATVLIGAPDAVVAPARLGLTIMLPWTWAIADRRFHQGVLIRLGEQKQVGIGTAARLVGSLSVLGLGFAAGTLPGVAVAAATLSTGVLVEAAYSRLCVARIGLGPIGREPVSSLPLTSRRLWQFYVPLAMTPLLVLIAQPIGAAGISRMPAALASLAIWPALNGLAFLLRAGGVAYNEVVVRHCGEPNAARVLGRLAWTFGAIASLGIVVVAATPFSRWWFGTGTGLEPALTDLACAALWWAAPLPLLSFLHSYYQGVLVHARKTRGIPEAVLVFLVVTSSLLAAAVVAARWPGASAALAAISAGAGAQAAWLRFRCRGLLATEADEPGRTSAIPVETALSS